MSILISILMSCTLSHADIPSQMKTGAAEHGECTGSFRDKSKGKVIGAWSMAVRFEPTPSEATSFKAIKVAGGIVVPRMEDNPQALVELENNTLLFIVEAVKSGVAREFVLESDPPVAY